MTDSNQWSQSTLPVWIGQRARRHPERQAIRFVEGSETVESWTYDQLWRRSCAVAQQLQNVAVEADPLGPPRAILLYPPGIEFLAGFLGCQIAGWIPVPTSYPRPGRAMPRLDSAANDSQAAAILGDSDSISSLDLGKLGRVAASTPLLVADSSDESSLRIDPDTLSIDPDGLALLQYTSGSTSEPKGVMVRHRNLMANLEAIRRGFHIEMQADDAEHVDCGVFWLPFFHDMGLIGGILAPLYVGGHTILMSPRAFLQRPLRWLQCISEHRAVISGAPNFAYQLCADRIDPDQTDDLDLSSWRTAFCGAEPVLPRTLKDFSTRFSSCGFSIDAFYPCYGLAEASLLAAGGDGPSEPEVITVQRESLGKGCPKIIGQGAGPQGTGPQGTGPEYQQLVSCGKPVHQTEIVLVDPQTLAEVPSSHVGEIWLRGTSITKGYWNSDQENKELFDAQLTGRPTDDPPRGFCRTGDLGFLHRGNLFVTGRLKDVIILRGRNLFPQDIEATVRETMGIQSGQCAAFPIETVRGERLAIVAELPRRADKESFENQVRSIRRSIIEVHEVDPHCILLVRQATVPLTSSGKVQRSRCRELFNQDAIQTKFRYDRASLATQVPLDLPVIPAHPTTEDHDRLIAETEHWMTQWLIARAGVDPEQIALNRPFADYGLDSMTAIEMSSEIEDWSGVQLTPTVAWNYPTVEQLSSYLTGELIGEAESPIGADQVDLPNADLEALLNEVENLSEDEINDALSDKRTDGSQAGS